MARIDSIALPFTHAGLDEIIKLFRLKQRAIYKSFVKVNNSKQGYYRMAQEGDFGPAAEVNQGTAIPFQDYKTGPYKDTKGIKHGIGFAIARETVEADVYGIVRERGPKIARAMNRTIDADMANHINQAQTTQVTPPDGAALAGPHNYDGGVYSNVIAGNPALSVFALETAVQSMLDQPSQTGDPSMIDGPFNLIVPTALKFLAERITGADKLPQTNNNDPNAVRGSIKNVIVNPFITSPTAWAICVADDTDNPLRMLMRRDFDPQEDFDKVRDLNIYVATQIWARMLSDWRGFSFSPGQ